MELQLFLVRKSQGCIKLLHESMHVYFRSVSAILYAIIVVWKVPSGWTECQGEFFTELRLPSPGKDLVLPVGWVALSGVQNFIGRSGAKPTFFSKNSTVSSGAAVCIVDPAPHRVWWTFAVGDKSLIGVILTALAGVVIGRNIFLVLWYFWVSSLTVKTHYLR